MLSIDILHQLQKYLVMRLRKSEKLPEEVNSVLLIVHNWTGYGKTLLQAQWFFLFFNGRITSEQLRQGLQVFPTNWFNLLTLNIFVLNTQKGKKKKEKKPQKNTKNQHTTPHNQKPLTEKLMYHYIRTCTLDSAIHLHFRNNYIHLVQKHISNTQRLISLAESHSQLMN